MKLCSNCFIHKIISEFNKDSSKKDGLECCCKKCKKKYYIKNKKKISRGSAARYLKNKIKILNRQKEQKNNNRIKFLIKTAKTRAKEKNIEFNITEQDFVMMPEICPILNKPFNLQAILEADFFSPTLDRIDSTKGYIKGNVRIISWRANIIKCNLTKEEMGKLICWLKDPKILINENKIITENSLKYKFQRMFLDAKFRAKKFNRSFSITFDYLKSLYVENCPILEIPLLWKNETKIAKYNSPSLDRIDSTKGYEIGNVIIVSNKINTAKKNATIEELELIYQNAYET